MIHVQSALAAPAFVVGQATLGGWAGLAVAALWATAMAVVIARARPALARIGPTLILPLPWIALAMWAGYHDRAQRPAQAAAAHEEVWALAVVASTLVLSLAALVRARGVRLPVLGLVLLNGWFCLVAALVSVMMVSGVWL